MFTRDSLPLQTQISTFVSQIHETSKIPAWSTSLLTIAFCSTSCPLSFMKLCNTFRRETQQNIGLTPLGFSPFQDLDSLSSSCFGSSLMFSNAEVWLFMLVVMVVGFVFIWGQLFCLFSGGTFVCNKFVLHYWKENLKHSCAHSEVPFAAKTPEHRAPRRRSFLGKKPQIPFAFLPRHLPNNHCP